MKLEELKAYQTAMEIGEVVYTGVSTWPYFDRKTIGEQLVRAADSIAANISEGYGRHSFKENKVFLYYARGSAHETKTWVRKANARGLMETKQTELLSSKIEFNIALINGLIKSTGHIPQQV